MTRLRFEHTGFEIEITRGTRVLDVCDDHHEAELEFSCRNSSCGTCRVLVLEGEKAFDSAEDNEEAVLELYGDPPSARLACQLRLVRDVPLIVLQKLDDED